MTTNSKEEMEIWYEATCLFKAGKLADSLEIFSTLGSMSKISFNMAMIQQAAGEKEDALNSLDLALDLDPFLACALLQKGSILYLTGYQEEAHDCFKDCLELLLENFHIDYTQLGMKYKLNRCEVLLNLALSAGSTNLSRYFLDEANRCAEKDEHHRMIREFYGGRQQQQQKPFSVPLTCIFEVLESKLKNLKKKDYLKDAKLVLCVTTSSDDMDKTDSAGFVINNFPMNLDQPNNSLQASDAGVPSITIDSSSIKRSKSIPNNATTPRTPTHVRKISAPSKSLDSTYQQQSMASIPPPNDPSQPPKRLLGARKSSLSSNLSRSRSNGSNTNLSESMQRKQSLSNSDSGYEDETFLSRKFSNASSIVSPNQVKIKVHSNSSTITLVLSREVDYTNLMNSICSSLGLSLSQAPRLFYQYNSDRLQLFDNQGIDEAFSRGGTVHFYE